MKRSLRKRQEAFKLKAFDDGVGDLVPWSSQIYRFWCHPNSKFNDPSMYMAINGELFTVTLVSMLVLTLIVGTCVCTYARVRARVRVRARGRARARVSIPSPR